MKKKRLFLLSLLGVLVTYGPSALAGEWAQHGGDIRNSRYQDQESIISRSNVSQLTPKWMFATPGDVTGTPTVDNGKVYFGDWMGNIYRVDAATGTADWSVNLSSITGFPDLTRHSLSVEGDYVIFGNQSGRFGQGGAKLIALDKETGSTVWVTQLDPYPFMFVTSSPTVYQGVAYVGVASFEEGIAGFVPDSVLPCCFSRGSVVAVDANTGQILWQTYTVPDGSASPPPPFGDGRFSGNGVWGSAPAVDIARNQLYVATGNNYSAPVSYHECIEDATSEAEQIACNPADNYFDSVLAIDLDTGGVIWSKQALPYDTWNVACAPFLLPGVIVEDNCTYDNSYAYGPDFDFGQAPILYKVRGSDRVGAGQKSGIYWSLDPDTGAVIWQTRTGPGGLAGGHQWGSASDGSTIYTSNANSFSQPWTLPGNGLTYAGIFSAIDSATGAVRWQTANPSGATAGAAAAVANGVMYACSGSGAMYALNTRTGAVLWSFESGSPCGSGASIVDGTVYWGTGYAQGLGGPPIGTTGVYAFGIPAP